MNCSAKHDEINIIVDRAKSVASQTILPKVHSVSRISKLDV
jgi:hypothetical protein